MSLSESERWLRRHASAQKERLAAAPGPSDARLQALLELGRASRALADPAALNLLLEALDLATELGLPPEQELATLELGGCLAEQGQAPLGRRHLARLLEKRDASPTAAARAAAELAILDAREGQLPLARAALAAAGGAYQTFARGVVACAEGKLDASAQAFEAAISAAGDAERVEVVALRYRAGQALIELEDLRRRSHADPFEALGAEDMRRLLRWIAQVGLEPAGERLARCAQAICELSGAACAELRVATATARWPQLEAEPRGRSTLQTQGEVSLRVWPGLGANAELIRALLSAGAGLLSSSAEVAERAQVLDLLDQVLASDLEGTPLFDLTTRLAIEATGAARGALVLVSDDAPLPPSYVSTSLVRRVALTSRPLLLEDAAAAPPTGAGESVTASNLRSVLAVPLLGRRGQVLGVLYLDHPGSAGRFGPSQLAVLTGFATRLGPQLESWLREALRRSRLAKPEPEEELPARSPAMRAAAQLLQKAAQVDAPLLLCGESGVGKEHVARQVHRRSARAAAPFVVVACGVLSEDLLESELFGHEAGAFTGAVQAREGLLASADGGVVFLDGLDDASPRLQAELLRVAESGEIRPVGGQPRTLDVRFVTGYSGDPQADVAAGALRQDLLYRLNVLTVTLPPLRDRREELPELVTSVLRALGAEDRSLTPAALAKLSAHAWPGNLRELRACLERALLSAGPTISPEHLFMEACKRPGPATQLNHRQLELLDQKSSGEWVRTGEYAAQFKISPATAWRDLSDLVSKGLLRAQGSGRGVAYCVT